MACQVRALQSAGISGFPYFNHDAGGHANVTVNEDNLYRQWDMGFGSFTPIWKPHGPSHKRWPLQRNSVCQNTAKTFITTRYQMIPYIYSYARIAQATGVPMARPMFLDDQDNETAWQNDLQYMWGKEILVAPNCSDGNNSVPVWLPKGNWYYFWDDKKYAGNKTESISAATGVVPVFVREGAVIPMAPYAKSTFFIPKDTLIIHVYTGTNGSFRLYEDDGVTEKFRTKNESRLTDIQFTQDNLGVEIKASTGSFAGAPSQRCHQIIYHGLSGASPFYCGGIALTSYPKMGDIPATGNGAVWDSEKKLLNVRIASNPVTAVVRIANTPVRIFGGEVIKQNPNSIRLSHDELFVETARADELHVSIHQLNGRKIRSLSQPSRATGSCRIFSLRRLALGAGMYLLKVENKNTVMVRDILFP